jgi:TonB family protein
VMAMKTKLLGLLTLLAAGPLLAAPSPGLPEDRPLRILQTEEARFPWMLSQQGITEGWALVALVVDSEGVLTDTLPVAHTRREFADEAILALRRWRYEPTRMRGQAINTKTEVLFTFQAVGVVVTFDIGQYLARMTKDRPDYRPCTLRELDRIPMPVVAPAPAYGKWLLDKGVSGQCVIEFYIDESGAARVPAVAETDFPELGILAIAAVETWRFEPPTSGNRPVLAKVRQTFTFR